MMRFLKKLRGLRWVTRWNFHPRIKNENVAEHSFYTAIYAMALALIMDKGEKYLHDVTMAALLHDVEEAVTGDLPALVKRRTDWNPVVMLAREELLGSAPLSIRQWIKNVHVSAGDLAIVKAADLISALAYASDEIRLGSAEFFDIRDELIGSLVKMRTGGDQDLAKAIGILLEGMGYGDHEGRERIEEMSHL